jgi:hypothetical protein
MINAAAIGADEMSAFWGKADSDQPQLTNLSIYEYTA